MLHFGAALKGNMQTFWGLPLKGIGNFVIMF